MAVRAADSIRISYDFDRDGASPFLGGYHRSMASGARRETPEQEEARLIAANSDGQR